MSYYQTIIFYDPIKMVMALKEHTEKFRFNLNSSGGGVFYSQRTKKRFKLQRSAGSFPKYNDGKFDAVGIWKINDFDSWNTIVDQAWKKSLYSHHRNIDIVFIKELINCKIMKLGAFI